MSRGRLVVTAVRLEGRTKSEVARDYGVSRQWVHELVKRCQADADAGLEPRSRRPPGSPTRTSEGLEATACPRSPRSGGSWCAEGS